MIGKISRILVAIIIAILIWWVGPLLAIGIYHPLASSTIRKLLVLVVLLWGLWPLLARFWARLAMTTRRTAVPPKVDQDNPVDEIFAALDKQLKAAWSRAPKSRWRHFVGLITRQYRSQRPWHLILGTESAPRTGILARACPPYARSSPSIPHQSVNGVAETQDLGLCIDQNAVWLDLHGRWNIRPAAEIHLLQDWRRLLTKLCRLGSPRALSGILICIDVTDIVHAAADARRRLAHATHSRLNEVRAAFGLDAPVYLAVTGLERLDGAAAMLACLDASKWVQGVGCVAADEKAPLDASSFQQTWSQALAQLRSRLQQHVLYAVPTAADVQANYAQLQFVEAFSLFQQGLLDWIQDSFVSEQKEATARLRGIWFGVTEGTFPAAHASAQATGPNGGLTPALAGELWSPLVRQILLEQGSSIPAARQTWRRRGISRLCRWFAPLMALSMIAWMVTSFVAERDYLDSVRERFLEAKRLAAENARYGLDTGSPLAELAGEMRYVQLPAAEPNERAPNLYIERRLVAMSAQAAYGHQLRKRLMPELYNEVRHALISQVDTDTGDVYGTLKVYLMLSRPDRRSAEDVARWVDARWPQLTDGRYSETDRRTLLAHVYALISLPDLPATPEDPHLVRSARAKAVQVPTVTRVLQHIRAQGFPARVNHVSLARAGGYGAGMNLRMRNNVADSDTTVSGWFTRAGYTDVFMPRLVDSARAVLQEASWVLRDDSLPGNSFEVDGLVKNLADATRSQFLQDYILAWKNFLSHVAARNTTGLDDASHLAAAMMELDSPLANLLRTAAFETTLTGVSGDGRLDSWMDRQEYRLEQWRKQIVGGLNGHRYRTPPLPEQIVEANFQALHQLASQLSPDKAGTESALARLFEPIYRQLGLVHGALRAGQMLPAQYDAFTRLRESASRQPEPVRGIMLDLVNSGHSMSTNEAGALLNRGAADATKSVCNAGITDRYPFRRSVQDDAGIGDFERLFSSQGAMATYFREKLAPYLDTSSTPWRVLPHNNDLAASISEPLIASYEAAEQIRAVTLDGSGRLQISAALRFIDMDPQLAEAELAIGGQSYRFAHGMTSPINIQWPPPRKNQAIRLHVRSIEGRMETLQFDGPWALLRFFDAGETAMHAATADRREQEYQTPLGTVHLEWQAPQQLSPIWSGVLQAFRCPS
jgi:type VI secretion system protein ImpL